MALANLVKRKRISDLTIALKTAEQALAEIPKPIVTPIDFLRSERDEIRQCVTGFRAHQEKMAREREHHYLQVKARMPPPSALQVDRKKNPSS